MAPCLNWYALYTKPQCERIVSQRLQVKGFETYLPPASADSSHRPTGPQSFFPGYLFVRLDPKADDLSSVQWTPGLKHIVGFNGRPAVVPDELIVLIQERLAANCDKETRRGGDQEQKEDVPLSPRPLVPLSQGVSLSQMEAVFEGVLKPAERTWVLTCFLDQVNKVQAPTEDPAAAGLACPISRASNCSPRARAGP